MERARVSSYRRIRLANTVISSLAPPPSVSKTVRAFNRLVYPGKFAGVFTIFNAESRDKRARACMLGKTPRRTV